jgi:glycosyltransferase involved in cell wall biosynthesis
MFSFFIFGSVPVRDKKDFFIEPPLVRGFEFECGINLFRKKNYQMLIKSYLKELSWIYSEWKPDLIHAHDIYPAGIIAMYISRKYKVPYIISQHNYLRSGTYSFEYSDIKNALGNAVRILPVSQYILKNILDQGVKCRHAVTGNFADDTLYTLPEDIKEKSQFRILFIGRNSVEKDIPTLIKTIREFDNRCMPKDYCFMIIGSFSGTKEETFKELIDLENSGNLVFQDFIDRRSMAEIMHNSDVLLSTSISESFGLAACEAMMCGLPVVSTNNGGFNDIYVPGVNGLKTNTEDYLALVDSLYKIKMGEIKFDPAGIRESVRCRYGTVAFKERLTDIYNSVNA